jgi:hypothetical protein
MPAGASGAVASECRSGTVSNVMRSSRRQFIVAGGATVALAACGSTKSSSKSFTVLSRLTDAPLLVPGKSRLAVSLADTTATLAPTGPATLTAAVLDKDDKVVQNLTAKIHDTDISVAYWPFEIDIAEPGFYTLRVKGDDGKGANFGVFKPSDVTMPYLGSILPAFDTPTVSDHRGVEPYCSLTPNPCALHDMTLTDALKKGTPVVYMVGTPAHCVTGACAPSLEFLVATHQRVGDRVAMVHADVFADNAGTQYSPAVNALALQYEPVAYFCKPDGTIIDRLDGVWDQSEVDATVDKLIAGA